MHLLCGLAFTAGLIVGVTCTATVITVIVAHKIAKQKRK